MQSPEAHADTFHIGTHQRQCSALVCYSNARSGRFDEDLWNKYRPDLDAQSVMEVPRKSK
jgi:hypothetical protein